MKKIDNIVNEPGADYIAESQIKHFSSFETANEADAKEMAALTPEEHLQNATLLIQGLYKQELSKPMNKTIHFKK